MSKVKSDYFHSLRANYKIRVAPDSNMSQEDGLVRFLSDIKAGISTMPGITTKKTEVSTRWEGEQYSGRNLVIFSPPISEGTNVYTVLEFEKDESMFFVRDSLRHLLTREAVCNMLDSLANVYPLCPEA